MGWDLNVGMIASPPGDLDVCVCVCTNGDFFFFFYSTY